jgi:hypothetical protein
MRQFYTMCYVVPWLMRRRAQRFQMFLTCDAGSKCSKLPRFRHQPLSLNRTPIVMKPRVKERNGIAAGAMPCLSVKNEINTFFIHTFPFFVGSCLEMVSQTTNNRTGCQYLELCRHPRTLLRLAERFQKMSVYSQEPPLNACRILGTFHT